MQVVVKFVGDNAQVININGSLESMQAVVGGLIEAVPIGEYKETPLLAICNEEGKLNGSVPNLMLYTNRIIDTLNGDIFICTSDNEDFAGLNDDIANDIARALNAGERVGIMEVIK